MGSLHPVRLNKLEEFEKRIGITFENKKLLNMALTHPTYIFENRDVLHHHNQRLEFLGDAVLGMIVAEHLYTIYPKHPEGQLTKLRANLVCETALASNAKRHNIGSVLLLGRGEEMSGGRERPSILADAYEALVGAMYLDSGLTKVRDFVVRDIHGLLTDEELLSHRDYKTLLQELVQKHHDVNVTYSIISATGPDHDKRFVAGVSLRGEFLAEGKGKSKKEAEQEAARVAYHHLLGSYPRRGEQVKKDH